MFVMVAEDLPKNTDREGINIIQNQLIVSQLAEISSGLWQLHIETLNFVKEKKRKISNKLIRTFLLIFFFFAIIFFFQTG